MTTTTRDRVDQLDATAETLTDLGLPSLAEKLRDVIHELTEEAEQATARTPGQVAWDAMVPENLISPWTDLPESEQADWERAARAVITWHEAQTPAASGRCPFVCPDGIRCELGLDGHGVAHYCPKPAPDPAWTPTVGAWAEHADHGRVLILRRVPEDPVWEWRWARPYTGGREEITGWCATDVLSAPVPRTWQTADEVPDGVLVADDQGVIFTRYEAIRGISRGPWHEVGYELLGGVL